MKPANQRDALTIASLAVVGIVLGAAIAPLFAPVPKTQPARPTQLSARTSVSASGESQTWIEPGPEDATSGYAGSYVPSDTYDGAIWQYPAPDYESWEPESAMVLDESVLSDIRRAMEAANAADETAKNATEAEIAQEIEAIRKADFTNGVY